MAKRKIYSADLEVYATIYVISDSKEMAIAKIREQLGNSIEVGESDDVSSIEYSSPDMPDVSFSPAMTISSKQEFSVELVEELDVDLNEEDDSDEEDEVD